MKFKFTYLLEDTTLFNENMLNFDFPIKSKLNIKIYRVENASEEIKGLYSKDSWTGICETTLIKIPKSKNNKIFEYLAKDKIPPGVKNDEFTKINNKWAMNHFPQSFRDFCDQIESEALDFSKRTINYVRWKYSLPSPHNPIRNIDRLWLFSGKWFDLPKIDNIIADVLHAHKITDTECVEIVNELMDGKNEPIAHELFREAWSSRFKNQRSSIVIGIAALETSLKHIIADLVPDAQWLLFETQSPPVIKILKEYLPSLPVKNLKDRSKFYLPPDEILDNIEKGVQIRNCIVHGRKTIFDIFTLEDILRSIKFILYLIDYYSGYKWAKELIRADGIRNFVKY